MGKVAFDRYAVARQTGEGKASREAARPPGHHREPGKQPVPHSCVLALLPPLRQLDAGPHGGRPAPGRLPRLHAAQRRQQSGRAGPAPRRPPGVLHASQPARGRGRPAVAALAASLPHLRSRLSLNGPPVAGPYSADLALALALADAADLLSLQRFRALDLVVETKPDLTPVSDADRAVEAAIRTTLAAQRP